jgi:hypothetical protein
MEQPKIPEASAVADLSKMAHLLRNHLFVISIGIKSLEMTREDPDVFARVLETIRSDAFEGLEKIADSLDGMAAAGFQSGGPETALHDD